MARRPRTPQPNTTGQVMTVDQVAAYLQLNRLTVYRYVREGKIPAAKIGKVYRVLREDVDRFLETRMVLAQGTPARPEAAPAPSQAPRATPPSRTYSDEIYVGPTRRERSRNWDSMILEGDPLAVIIRGLH